MGNIYCKCKEYCIGVKKLFFSHSLFFLIKCIFIEHIYCMEQRRLQQRNSPHLEEETSIQSKIYFSKKGQTSYESTRVSMLESHHLQLWSVSLRGALFNSYTLTIRMQHICFCCGLHRQIPEYISLYSEGSWFHILVGNSPGMVISN